jgi:hypothetical protein
LSGTKRGVLRIDPAAKRFVAPRNPLVDARVRSIERLRSDNSRIGGSACARARDDGELKRASLVDYLDPAFGIDAAPLDLLAHLHPQKLGSVIAGR